jgi:hypothetical protein
MNLSRGRMLAKRDSIDSGQRDHFRNGPEAIFPGIQTTVLLHVISQRLETEPHRMKTKREQNW